MKGTSVEVRVEGRALTLTNLQKVLWPSVGFTKAQTIDYYRKVWPLMKAHVRGRPLTRIRFPHGVADKSFFEKNAPSHTPDWVRTEEVTHKGEAIRFVVCDDLPTLVWLANLAALELHPQLHLAKDPERPTCVVFDLDPGPPAALKEACEVAVLIRDLLEELGLRCWPKVSGGKGLQLYMPLNTPATYDQTKYFAQSVAKALERAQPERVLSKMAKVLRKGKVFVDWSQNDQVKTTVAAYSLRARERPTVSAPVTWEEVEAGGLVVEAPAMLERAAELGDLFAPVATTKQELPKLA